ncbi:auxin-binding protein ABP19a-like, partial [Vitis vinifera]|uniref:auxin-binding protein ABP19a-like n=1 Tax=Vitis vinifera TaxID=29760 RepID=UPI0028830C40
HYSCKTPAEVTADDFVYSGLRVPGNTSTLFNAAINSASVHKFPVLNGLGVSVARADIAPGGVLPMHTHPGGSEIILVAKGSVTAGLISSDDTVYLKTVEEGNIMVFSQGLLHFLVNTGGTQALLWGVKGATIGSGANSGTADNNLAVVELMKK